MIQIKRALLSVSDKTGIVDFARKLKELDVEIISTGGTGKKLEDSGIPYTKIEEVTGNPEAFGGRMKTISFHIESALLFDREKDKQEAERLSIKPIDLVVCNLYPFSEVVKQKKSFETWIENIDIGGPTMIRAAAKNFKYVSVLTTPADYNEFLEHLTENKGKTSYDFRRKLMTKAFNHTADYDSLIAQVMDYETGQKSLRLHFTDGKSLRYGENSHQEAFMYRKAESPDSYHSIKLLNGKDLSYNNILDIQAAVQSVEELSEQACVVIKHSNPCGLAQSSKQQEALRLAWQGDPISAFGSIIAFNSTLSKETVSFFQLNNPDKSKRKFIEVIVAPKIEPEALEYLSYHKNLRVIEYAPKAKSNFDMRFVEDTLLCQEKDTQLFKELRCADPSFVLTDARKKMIEFGLKAVKHIKSNAIVIVGEKEGSYYMTGMGAGQPNRLISTQLAISKTKDFIRSEQGTASVADAMQNLWLVSDAFFPFADNVELAAKENIKYIAQPGGSIRDKSVTETCKQLGVQMVFTGLRHFKH